MTTPAAVAHRVAEILGGGWRAIPGSWETSGHLDVPDASADTYTLVVDEHGELCLLAELNPNGAIAVFRDIRAPEGIEAITLAIADAIREDQAADRTSFPTKNGGRP